MIAAQAANAARNRIIHTPWVVTQESGVVPDAVLLKGSMLLEDRTGDELRQDMKVMGQAVSTGRELLALA